MANENCYLLERTPRPSQSFVTVASRVNSSGLNGKSFLFKALAVAVAAKWCVLHAGKLFTGNVHL